MTPEEIEARAKAVADIIAQKKAGGAAMATAEEAGPIEDDRSGMERFRDGLATGVKSIIPFGMASEYLGITKDDPNATSLERGIDKGVAGFAMGFSGGLLPHIEAVSNELSDRIRGVDEKNFRERVEFYNEYYDDASSMVGEIGGSIVGLPGAVGKGLVNVSTKTPWLGELLRRRTFGGFASRTATTSALAAGEGMAYEAAKGGTLEEISEAGKWSAIFGAGMNPMAELLAAAGKRLGSVLGLTTDEEVAKHFRDMVALHYGDDFLKSRDGEAYLNTDVIRREMASSDDAFLDTVPKAVLDDVYTLTKERDVGVRYAVKSLVDFIENRAIALRPKFKDAVDEVLARPQTRTAAQIQTELAENTQKLQLAYDQALKNVPRYATKAGYANAKPVKLEPFKKDVAGLFKKARKVPHIADLEKSVMSVLGDAKTMTPRQLLLVRHGLDEMIYSGKTLPLGGTDAKSISKAHTTQYLIPLRQRFNQHLYNVIPDLKQVDQNFSSEYRMRHAYDAGYDLFSSGGKKIRKARELAATTDRNAMEQAYFTEGVRNAIGEALEDKSPQQIQNYLDKNEEMFKQVAEILGQDAIAQIREAAHIYARDAALIKAGTQHPGRSSFQLHKSILPTLYNFGLATVGLGSKYASSAAGLGALRNELATNPTFRPSGAAYRAANQVETMTSPTMDATKYINEMLYQNLPGPFKGLIAGSAAAGANVADE